MKTQTFFNSSDAREGESDVYTHIVLYFNNTPRQLFNALKKRNPHWTNPPPTFKWGYCLSMGEPCLFVSFELARPATAAEAYRLARVFAAIFEPHLAPVWRYRLSPTESGTCKSPVAPGEKIDPDAYLNPMK